MQVERQRLAQRVVVFVISAEREDACHWGERAMGDKFKAGVKLRTSEQ